MSVKYALLGLLRDQARNPYELGQLFEERIGPHWDLNKGQVYQIVNRLERDGLVERCAVDQAMTRAKHVFKITPLGEDAYTYWLEVRSNRVTPLRGELLVKVALARPNQTRALLDDLSHQERLCKDQLNACSPRLRPRPPIDQARDWKDVMKSLSTRAAVKHLEAEIAWLQETRETIVTLAGQNRES